MNKFITVTNPTLRRLSAAFLALAAVTAIEAATITVTVKDIRYQTVTGFGAAACDGAMCPFGSDTQPVRLLYGPTSKIGLNIMRMEISPNFKGDISFADVGWDTPYDWKGSLPCAKEAKKRGALVFGTPWSPPGEYKTNGTAQGGNSESQGYKRGELRKDCYDKFFPWLNTFLDYMKKNGVDVDAVSIQNEPDWWVNYSGCLYSPEQQLDLVKNHADALDRETYGVRLISAEPLGFDPKYSNMLLNDPQARKHIDIIAGHLYGHPPLVNMKNAANFCLEQVEDDGTVLRMGVGNIVLADREGTTVNGITSITYNDDLIITDGDDPEIPFWIGSALGPVPIEMEARFNDTQLYCEIHINLMDLLGQLIDVVFGAEPEAVEEEAITAPTISLKEGVRNMVTIGVGTTSLENGSVTTYFTIDGTDPSAENGTAITEDTDVALSEDCTVKAVTVSSSGKQSEVVAFDFTYEVESGISQMTDATRVICS